MKLPFAQVEPTTRCNFTCGFCAGRHMAQQDLPLEAFRAFIDQVEGLEDLELQGEGEPLIHPRFFELVACARRKFPELRISMISNGSLFTAENIERLLEHRIARIFVSLESADDIAFQRIRGGKLERVRRGVASLVAERDAHGLKAPVVGLALTVLRTTLRQSTRAISDLYRELGLDGGILVQPLQAMPAYSTLYSAEIRDEMLDAQDARRFDADAGGNPEFIAAMRARMASPGFYERLYSSVDPRRRCPWLENGIYVAAGGEFVPCCHAKDYAKDKLGDFGSGLDAALEARAAMRQSLAEGKTPPSCTGCAIARAIVTNR